ncbi:MAG: hypothetical protein HSCHL_0628 [Hydrogenibacillus schlegelii]|uniref:Transposase IS204/IS1001/IS1096/IS1165 DDE domain-containing protein n=1 Tax=Hydrogenibacillus schlegelii TaxID=1484 RepID=A0A2T5G815_HYDSH|nr:MAG: hypothetical protein HSCHL_0628 [Hydrogenibacillus schlegelii]
MEQKPVSLRIRPRRFRAKTKQTSPSVRRKRRPREEAKAILDRIRFEAEEAGDAALVPWGRTLKRRKNEILADHPWRTTNGDIEGVHPKVKRRNRIRDGFKNREGVVRKMLLAFIPFAHRIAGSHFLTWSPRFVDTVSGSWYDNASKHAAKKYVQGRRGRMESPAAHRVQLPRLS